MRYTEHKMHLGGEVLDRMREVVGASSDAALGRELDVPQSTVSAWRQRESVPLKYCVKVSEEYSANLQWILTGLGEKTKILPIEEFEGDRDIIKIAALQYSRTSLVEPFQAAEKTYKRAEYIIDSYIHTARLLRRLIDDAGMTRSEALKFLEDAAS